MQEFFEDAARRSERREAARGDRESRSEVEKLRAPPSGVEYGEVPKWS